MVGFYSHRASYWYVHGDLTGAMAAKRHALLPLLPGFARAFFVPIGRESPVEDAKWYRWIQGDVRKAVTAAGIVRYEVIAQIGPEAPSVWEEFHF
jgi:hypothetical protein